MEYYYDIETTCPKTLIPIILSLTSKHDFKGKIVDGKPTLCNKEFICPFKNDPMCLLQAKKIEAKKRGH